MIVFKITIRDRLKRSQKGGFVSREYLYKSKAYKRNDTATIEVDTLEFSRLVLDGKNINFEELPFPGIDIVKFGENISIIQKRVIYENISVLDVCEKHLLYLGTITNMK